MAVFLTVLKITGIVILCLIGLIFLAAALILFVPIRYRIKGRKDRTGDELFGMLGVSWLLHIISGKFIYDDGFVRSIKLFGIKIWPRKEKPETEPEDKGEEEYTVDWNEEADTATETAGETETSEERADEISGEDTDSEDDDLFDQIGELLEKLSAKYDFIAAKYEKIRKELRFWKKYIDDEHNRIAFTYIKNKLVKLLKKIAPRRIKGFLHFGFDDPATTGQILVYLSLIYPVIPRDLNIEPGFEDTDIYGNLDIKGYVRLIAPVCAFIGVYFNRDCRRMWHIYKKHSEKY